jgi:hypothetical protein
LYNSTILGFQKDDLEVTEKRSIKLELAREGKLNPEQLQRWRICQVWSGVTERSTVYMTSSIEESAVLVPVKIASNLMMGFKTLTLEVFELEVRFCRNEPKSSKVTRHSLLNRDLPSSLTQVTLNLTSSRRSFSDVNGQRG